MQRPTLGRRSESSEQNSEDSDDVEAPVPVRFGTVTVRVGDEGTSIFSICSFI